MEDLIAREEMVVTVSHEGYIKRQPIDTYRSQSRGGRGIKGTESREGDFVDHLFVANTHDHILFFTNKGRTYTRRVFDIPELSRTSGGRSIANFLEFQEGEKIANVLATPSLEKDEHFVFFATAKGTVKKTALSAFANINRRGIIAIGLEEGDSLIGVEITSGHDHVMLGTKSGLAIRFDEDEVRAMGRQAGGVTGARFKREGDEVVSLLVIPSGINEGTQVLTACLNGFGKRTPLEEYPTKGRGTRGVINIEASDRNGEVVGMKLVCEEDGLMLITEKGILIRTRVKENRETGRGAAGVRIIRIDEGDRLVAMARVDAEDDQQPEAAAPENAAPDAPETPAPVAETPSETQGGNPPTQA
jgi:DNA gyrase subunit A